jgi:hypothetical protein
LFEEGNETRSPVGEIGEHDSRPEAPSGGFWRRLGRNGHSYCSLVAGQEEWPGFVGAPPTPSDIAVDRHGAAASALHGNGARSTRICTFEAAGPMMLQAMVTECATDRVPQGGGFVVSPSGCRSLPCCWVASMRVVSCSPTPRSRRRRPRPAPFPGPRALLRCNRRDGLALRHGRERVAASEGERGRRCR